MSRPTTITSLADTRIGDRLTDYSGHDIEVRRIGSGGFGLVFMGPDRLDNGMWYALKTLRPEVLASERSRELFLREALTWLGLWPHPNLLTAQTVTQINGQLVLVLDYAQHGSLRDLLVAARRQGLPHLSLNLALSLARQIAAGLVALHTPDPAFLRPEPLVHRDLKPENVLLDEYGFAVITDFGLAKVVEQAAAADPSLIFAAAAAAAATDTATTADDTAPLGNAAPTRSQHLHTAAGVALGTPAYMAPEQWADAASASPPADLYAFGLILSELLAGRHTLLDLEAQPPASVKTWRAAHLGGPRRTLHEVVPTLPARVEDLYQRLLVPEPQARPTAGEALAELQAAAAELGEAPYTPPETYPHTPEHEMAIWNNRAQSYWRFGLHEEALLRIDRAYALAPHHPAVLGNRGNILAALGRLDEALACYDAVLAVYPADDHVGRKMVHHQRGVLFNNAGRFAEAEAAYTAALQETPDDPQLLDSLAQNERWWGDAEARAGHLAEARRHLQRGIVHVERAIAVNPSHLGFHRTLAGIRQTLAALGG